MTSRSNSFWRALQTAWTTLTKAPTKGRPCQEVVIHDPAAQRAQDLDDPFLDPGAQARAADLIARARRKSD